MTYNEFSEELHELGLRILLISDTQWSVGYSRIANPMLHFNPSLEEKDYDGSISVKSINIGLFQSHEIKGALELVNELLLTQLSERGELIRLI